MTETEQTAGGRQFSEAARKSVHICLGFIALGLEWLTWPVAAAVAFLALLFNAFVLPKLGGGRISRNARGTDRGIILYPLAVLLLIVVFRNRLDIAAVGWIALALGDGCATLIGRNMGGPKLPWNREKSLIGSLGFFEAAMPVAWLSALYLAPGESLLPTWAVVSVAIGVAAIVETLPTGIDDNITVPASAAFTMWALTAVSTLPSLAISRDEAIWLAVNLLLALAGYAARTVNRSGLIGGAMLGCALIHFGGWHLYVVLLAFFVIGSGVTKLGIGTKARSGIAQEEGGCRGFSHAFANVGMAVILAFLAATTSFDASVLWLAAVAALATATADTTASEVGQLLGRRPFMPLTLRRVPVGTEGAISVEGTLAGAAAAIVVAILGAALWRARSVAGLLPGDGAGLGGTLLVACIVALAAILGSWLESVAGSWNRTVERPLSNGTLNFLNTAVGALIALALLQLL